MSKRTKKHGCISLQSWERRKSKVALWPWELWKITFKSAKYRMRLTYRPCKLMNVTKCKRWHLKYWVLPLIGKISPLLQTVSWFNLRLLGGKEQASRCLNLHNQRDRISRRKAVRILNLSRSMTCLSGWRHLTRRLQQYPSLQVTQLRRLSSLTPANWQSLIGS